MNEPVNDRWAKTWSPGWQVDVDLVVVGSGVAGLTAALRVRELGYTVLVVTKQALESSSTQWAQGGVAVPGDERDQHDSIQRHVTDTVNAGAGLCSPGAVASILAEGPAAVRGLCARGARFDPAEGGGLARTREGGHTALRVVHAGGDATGAEVERTLASAVSTSQLPVLTGHAAVEALRTPAGAVGGVLVLDRDGIPGIVRAPAVLVATGDLGQLYQVTSNPDVATGDGLALGLRAGAKLADIEFIQFHPTVLYAPGARGRRPLVTEAVRGEGARLVDATGKPLMPGVHPLGDLAPRDVVSAAITRSMASAPDGARDHVFLDATGLVDFPRRFPTVHASCVNAGIDPIHEPIPVAPAAHFACGGLVTDTRGRTTVPGLYAAGEVARTGLHGGNRLASNSLLEGLVMGTAAAEAVAADAARGCLANRNRARVPPDRGSAPVVQRDVLQRVMSRYVGIGRDADGLAAAGSVLDLSSAHRDLDSHRTVEDAGLTLVAGALIGAAARRTESRGCHVRADCPDRDDRRWQTSQTVRLNPSGQPVVAQPLPVRWAA